MSIDFRYPQISDLRRRARARIPHFAFEYLDSGTGDELAMRRSRAALDEVMLTPKALLGQPEIDLSTPIMGRRYGAPFGVSPVGSFR